jgi:hypothetical protein
VPASSIGLYYRSQIRSFSPARSRKCRKIEAIAVEPDTSCDTKSAFLCVPYVRAIFKTRGRGACREMAVYGDDVYTQCAEQISQLPDFGRHQLATVIEVMETLIRGTVIASYFVIFAKARNRRIRILLAAVTTRK